MKMSMSPKIPSRADACRAGTPSQPAGGPGPINPAPRRFHFTNWGTPTLVKDPKHSKTLHYTTRVV